MINKFNSSKCIGMDTGQTFLFMSMVVSKNLSTVTYTGVKINKLTQVYFNEHYELRV